MHITLGFFINGTVMLASVAIINWKASDKRADTLTKIVMFIYNMGIILLLTVPALSRSVEVNPTQIVLNILIVVLAAPLYFFARAYNQYAKNKTSTEIMQKTIKEAVIVNVTMIIAIVSIIYMLIVYVE